MVSGKRGPLLFGARNMMRNRFFAFTLVLAMVVTMKPAEGYSAFENGTVGSVLDTRISFEVGNAEIGGVLKALAEAFDLNIVVSEDVKGLITLSLKDVRLEDALDLILQSTGYYYMIRDNIILIRAPEKNLATEVVPVSFVKPSEIQSSIEAFLSEQGSVSAIDANNRLVIKEMPQKNLAFEALKRLLNDQIKLIAESDPDPFIRATARSILDGDAIMKTLATLSMMERRSS